MSTTKYIVNNVTGQTINGESILPKYKVYTALLTQSGGDGPQSIYEGELTIGVTYFINGSAILDGCDFTNVGAPNNESGTYFVATGTTPNWGNTVNPDMLTYNNGAPVVTVLENTIGNIWFERGGVGYYNVFSGPDPLFPIGKTVYFLGSVGDDPASPSYGFLRSGGEDSCRILTQDFTNTDQDSMLNNTPIEIRVYN
jgi:hypothetical protein